MTDNPSQQSPSERSDKSNHTTEPDDSANGDGHSLRRKHCKDCEHYARKACQFFCGVIGFFFGWWSSPDRTVANFTIVLTMIAGIGLWIAYDTLVRERRAWIAPAGIKIQGKIEKRVPLALKIQFENTGNEPASDVRLALAPIIFVPIPPNSHGVPQVTPVPVADRIDCGRLDLGPSGETAFPSPERRIYDFLIWIFTGGNRDGVYTEFLEYKETFKIQGCIVYRIDIPFPWVGAPIRYSGFCYYAQPLPQTDPLYWEFRPCSGGHGIT